MPNVDVKKVEAFKNGRATLAEVFAIDSKQIAALLMTGYLLYEAQRYQQAKDIFEGFLILDPRNAYVHGILGSLYQKEGKNAAALDRYTVALTLSPDDINSRSNRGELYLKMGKFQEAATDLQRAIQLDSTGKNPAANRARMLIALTQQVLQMAKENGVEAVLQATKQIDQQLNTNRG